MHTSRAFYFMMKIAGIVIVLIFSLQVLGLVFNLGWFDGAEELSSQEKIVSIFKLFFVATGFGYVSFWFGVANCQSNGVQLERNGRVVSIPWSRVKGISQIPCFTPPLYRLTFTNGERPVYVMMRTRFIATIGFWSWDFTGFMKYVRRHIAQHSAAHETARNIIEKPW